MQRLCTTLFLFIAMGWMSIQVQAQSKLTDVNRSALTGIDLPEGSKQDKRMLSISSATFLLEMVSKKAGVSLKETEVLYLLPVSKNQFTVETLRTNVQQLGWTIKPVENEPEYYWLEQKGKYILAYFSASKKETNLYLANASGAPGNNLATDNKKRDSTVQQSPPPHQQPSVAPAAAVANKGLAFTTTNFDDGWHSVVQADWVEVSKGPIKVLLHYPKEGTIISADPAPHINNAWNILVGPRYSNLTNYRTTYINTYNRPYLGMGTATEISTGNTVFVVLFRQGETGWIEIITPDKASFVQQFRFDPESIQWDSESVLMNNLSVMMNYNKFAVGETDFTGTWTSDFSGMQQLYNIYTGNYAGMHINQSKETFEFTGNGNYNWKLLVVNGMVGNTKYAQVQSVGRLQLLNNWQVSCSDIEGKPKIYHAFFSCIKGARLLHLLDADYPGSGIYTIYGRK